MISNKRIIPILFVFFLSLYPYITFIEGAGYGEENESLGQFVDDYENADNVSIAVNVINNQTLECMELNYTLGVKDYEDFTTYTEDDAAGDLTFVALKVDWNTMRRDSDSHLFKDYGVDAFGDFEAQFTFDLTDVEAGDSSYVAIMWPFSLSNSDDGRAGVHATGGIGLELSQEGSIDDKFRFRLFQVGVFNAYGGYRAIGKFYITIDRSGTNVRFRLYTDEARTNLIETISSAGGTTTEYRYSLVSIGYDIGTDPADHSTGNIENLWFGNYSVGYETDGYFITDDYLNYTTGKSLTLLTNSSLPASTSITAEFSEDNSTWVDHEGNAGGSNIIAGFYALDLRDLNYEDCFIRYNFSGPGDSTPRLFQSRLITTEGPGIVNITLGAHHIFNASSISVIVGVLNGGNLASTYFVDDDWYNVSEENAIPGLDVRFNFTGIEGNVTCGCIEVFQTYTGHSQHEMYIQAWNFSDSSWDTLGSFIYNETAGWVCVGLGHNPEHFFNNGNMFVRFYHGDQGHLAHEIHVDRIDLRIVYGEECDEGDIIIESDFPWIAIAIILSIIAALLVWMKFGNQ